MLQSVPHAMAIDVSLHWYFELTVAEMNTIIIHHTSHIRRSFSSALPPVPVCVTSLYYGEATAITAHCDFDLYLYYVKTQIIQLDESQFLLLNIENYIVGTSPSSWTGSACKSCIVTLPPHHYLHTSFFLCHLLCILCLKTGRNCI